MEHQDTKLPILSNQEFYGNRDEYITYLERTRDEIIGVMNRDPILFETALKHKHLSVSNTAILAKGNNSVVNVDLLMRSLALVYSALYREGRVSEKRYSPFNEVFSVGGTSITMKVLSPERARIEEEALRQYGILHIMGNGDGACQVPSFIDKVEDGDHAILLMEALKGQSVPERLGELKGDYFSGDSERRSQARKKVSGLFSGLIQNLTFYQLMPPKFDSSQIERKNYSGVVKGSLENLVGFFGLNSKIGSLDRVIEDNLRNPRYVRFRDSYLQNFNVSDGSVRNLDYGKTNLEVVDSEDAVMMLENPWMKMGDDEIKLKEIEYLVTRNVLQRGDFCSRDYPFFCDIAGKLFVRGDIAEHMEGLEEGALAFVPEKEYRDYWHNRNYVALARHLRLASNYAGMVKKHGEKRPELRGYIQYHLAMAGKALGKVDDSDSRISQIKPVVFEMIRLSSQAAQ
ncbi:hypothetical protein HY212_05050 [Candidatus Pacearchaeota archaeon]|nr:hypothetical protein [Candidatus Pacearchaeota archaeon]